MRAYGIHPTHRLRLLASNAVVMHNGLVFEVYGIFVHKKTAPSGLDGGVSNFWGAVQKFQTALMFNHQPGAALHISAVHQPFGELVGREARRLRIRVKVVIKPLQ